MTLSILEDTTLLTSTAPPLLHLRVYRPSMHKLPAPPTQHAT